MSYTTLYRKFRPTKFEDVVGQEHITRTLRNQILANRIGHAYLFTGSRGTGKTSIAKIFARAINCLNPQDGEPCNECEICKASINNALTDIVEMDAASNNSVDDVRAIKDEVNFLPAVAKYRVYIIDEVHMLSTGAFNALLKTLEEPPKHVKFILATTEPQKLPATILSRCQRFDFKRISVKDIVKRLQFICKEEKVSITDEALEMIAVLAEGALRDAISILERCIQDNNVEQINENQIRDLVGIPKLEYVYNLSTSIINKDVTATLEIVKQIINDGKDLDNFLWETIKYIKDTLVYKVSEHLDLYTSQEKQNIASLAEKISKEELLQLIYNLSKLENDMKFSTQKSIIFETGLLKECISTSSFQEPIQNKRVIKRDVSQIPAVKEIQPENISKDEVPSEKVVKKVSNLSTNNEISNFLDFWPQVIDKIKQNNKMLLYANLLGTTAVQIDDKTVEINFSKEINSFVSQLLNDVKNKEIISKYIQEETGKSMQIKFGQNNTKKQKSVNKQEEQISDLAKKLNIPFDVIDE